jgi:iron complex outermembrane receptor protein
MRRFSSPHPLRHPSLSPLAAAVCSVCFSMGAQAQSTADEASILPSVGVTAAVKRQAKASIAGLGDGPAWQQPVQAQTFSQEMLKDTQVTRLADLTKLDASVTDSYNSVGYWDYLSVRGFTLDNGYNYRREGLPVSAETRFPLENKASLEVLKGTSGLQSGVSAPGGLVNMLVKRPEGRVRSAGVSLDNAGEASAQIDWGDRFGLQGEFGLRVNAAVAKLNTHFDNTEGHSRLLALAGDWRLSPNTLIEAEIEHSDRSQPTLAGMSLIGTALPSARAYSRHLNLNNQPWSQPVEMTGTTGTVRWTQKLDASWRSVVTYGEQHLRTNDHMAFPYGCYDAGSDTNFYAACPNGDLDLYDYRSDNEKRLMRSLKGELSGVVTLAGMRHELRMALLRSLYGTDLKPQAYNYSGTLNLANPYAALPAAPDMGAPSPNRWERTRELSIQDTVQLAPSWTAWLGMRHTRLNRHSVETDGDKDIRIEQTLNTPWAALGWTFAPKTQAYVSWGEGMESKAAPRRLSNPPDNAGQILPTLKSRQAELGVKGQYAQGSVNVQWGVNLFDIRRPYVEEVGNAYQIDGDARHRGVEGFWQGRMGAWGLGGSVMFINAERRRSQLDGVSGKDPVNVPERAIKLSGSYSFRAPWVTTVQADVVHEGQRWVDVANTVRLPSWTRVDLSVRAVQTLSAQRGITWRLGMVNAFNKRAWREAPLMFGGHTYLFQMPERTLTASAQIDF